jgi:Family of unknown function (DUF6209)
MALGQQPSAGAAEPVAVQVGLDARLHFLGNWTQSRRGYIQPGGTLAIDYDPVRLPQCRAEELGVAVWEIGAFVRFHPGEQFYQGPVISRGGPGTQPSPIPFNVQVPADAQTVEFWFQVTNILVAVLGIAVSVKTTGTRFCGRRPRFRTSRSPTVGAQFPIWRWFTWSLTRRGRSNICLGHLRFLWALHCALS